MKRMLNVWLRQEDRPSQAKSKNACSKIHIRSDAYTCSFGIRMEMKTKENVSVSSVYVEYE